MRARAAAALLALALLPARPAQAARIDLLASDLGGGSLVETDLGPGALGFDPAFPGFAPMRVVVVVEEGDPGAPLAWNALADNLSGALWAGFSIRLEGALWEAAGSVRANAGAVASVLALGSEAWIGFAAPGEPAGLDLGAALGSGEDWRIDLGALGAGGSFAMVLRPVAVPEPSAAVLLALGALGLAGRRRLRRR